MKFQNLEYQGREITKEDIERSDYSSEDFRFMETDILRRAIRDCLRELLREYKGQDKGDIKVYFEGVLYHLSQNHRVRHSYAKKMDKRMSYYLYHLIDSVGKEPLLKVFAHSFFKVMLDEIYRRLTGIDRQKRERRIRNAQNSIRRFREHLGNIYVSRTKKRLEREINEVYKEIHKAEIYGNFLDLKDKIEDIEKCFNSIPQKTLGEEKDLLVLKSTFNDLKKELRKRERNKKDDKKRDKVSDRHYRYICSNRGCVLRIIKCPYTFKSIEEGECPFCRGKMIEMPRCSKCGVIIDYEGKFCKNCGIGLSKRLHLRNSIDVKFSFDGNDLELL